MFEALHAVEYELPSFDTEAREVQLADVARSRVEIRHVRGASDATYLVNAFGDELLMQLQLNVHRLVVVYRAPRSMRSMLVLRSSQMIQFIRLRRPSVRYRANRM